MDVEKAFNKKTDKIIQDMMREAALFGMYGKRYNALKKRLKYEIQKFIDQHKEPTVFEAFAMMHKQDGTANGRKKCEFSL